MNPFPSIRFRIGRATYPSNQLPSASFAAPGGRGGQAAP